MEAKYVLPKEEYLNAVRLSQKKPLLLDIPKLLLIISFIFFSFYSLYLMYFGYFDYLGLLIISVLAILISVLFRPMVLQKRVNSHYKTSMDVGLENKMMLDDQYLLYENELSTVKRPWSKIFAWKENDDLMLLYVADQFFHVIPKRVFSENEEAEEFIRDKINQHSIPYKHIPPGSIMSAIFYLILVVLIFLSVFL